MSEMRKMMILNSGLVRMGAAIEASIDLADGPDRTARWTPNNKPKPTKNRAKVKAARKQRNKP
jgi:hypothetical protein